MCAMFFQVDFKQVIQCYGMLRVLIKKIFAHSLVDSLNINYMHQTRIFVAVIG
jgi:hypothetical protein